MDLKETAMWRLIDQTTPNPSFRAIDSFAYDDTLCESVGKNGSPPILRGWVHLPTVVLGIQDARLPNIVEAIRYIHDQNTDVVVRNSGGLAVALDSAVLNVSMIMKEAKKSSISTGYDTMVALLHKALQTRHIDFEVGEIKGSYCPGSYDLSINGRKFAGISQRRIRGAVAVQVYLCISGSGSARARFIQDIYKKAANGKPLASIPNLQPEVMGSLEELTGQKLTVTSLMSLLADVLHENGASLAYESLSESEHDRFVYYKKRLVTRNESISQHLI
ncbi:lipoate--protein ligase family protein [Litoribacterium kuwaitense]|uniref:lipoate--protein ligase family protein n=1 Tax=Litoribacterium kuwaitense TaxID=1398745 RepID=UPI001BABA7E0|nr:lipoate--protein ligase family protein [Litoribacterium kuwaitense]